MMAQGHLQGGTPSLWGFTFQEAACDQWVLRPRVWTAHSLAHKNDSLQLRAQTAAHRPQHQTWTCALLAGRAK